MTLILCGTCLSLNSHKPTKSTPEECCQCLHTSHKLRGMGSRSDPCTPLVEEGSCSFPSAHSAPGEFTAEHGGQGVLPSSRLVLAVCFTVEDFACNFFELFLFPCF